MSDQSFASAKIVPFPSRNPAAPTSELTAIEPTADGHERLRKALVALDEAVAGQRDAVAAWRGALADLGTVMAGLTESMQCYRGSLDTLRGRVAGLQAQAVQLERTADAAIANRPT